MSRSNPTRATPILGCLALSALSACGGAEAPRPPAPLSPPIVATPPDPQPPAAIAVVPAAPPSPPFVLAEPLPAATRTFTQVTLPQGVKKLVSIDGRSARDVWMLSDDGRVISWDGKGARLVKKPSCPFDARFNTGNGSSIDVHNEAVFVSITAEPDGLVLLGGRTESSYRGSYGVGVISTSAKGAKWSCGTLPPVVTPLHHVSPGGDVWAIEGERIERNGVAFAMPDRVYERAFWARSRFDAWLGDLRSGDVWHWNGAAWDPRHTDLAFVDDLWEDEQGAAWVTGFVAASDAEKRSHGAHQGSNALRRHPRGRGRAWDVIDVPADFNVQTVRGASSKDVWMLGKKRWYQWDGERLRAMDPAVADVAAAWATDTELWVVGSGAARAALEPR